MLINQNQSVMLHNAASPMDMSNYPNMPTPPSSSEDSPMYYNPSPTSFTSAESGTYIFPQSTESHFGDGPYLRILEQPIDRFRFRYKSEMTGTHGSLCGMNSDRSRKYTYPTVELVNYDKPAVIRCQIYQINAKDDNMPHAHRLVKKQGKDEKDDPHDARIGPTEGFIHTFHSMGIIHTAKKNIVGELEKKKIKLKSEEIAKTENTYRGLTINERQEIKGLAEAESKSINLNIVCLRFDAFTESNGILYPICSPVYSHWINNLKSALTGELKIVRMDHCTSPAKGGREIFILVERVTKKNIKIKFYEVDDEDNILWEDYGKFSDLDVHHQYAIVFKTPPYKNVNITTPVKVYIELERPSDKARSEPKEFTYIATSDSYTPGAKRSRPNYSSSSYCSSLNSDELPLPINNLCIEPEMNQLMYDQQVTSEELQKALHNIDSDEFKKIFSDFGAEYQSVTTDTPTANYRKSTVDKNRIPFKIYPEMAAPTRIQSKSPVLRNVSMEEAGMARRVLEELHNFIKTKPSEDKVIIMLQHYFSQPNKTNALHVSVKQNDAKAVLFFLKLMFVWKQTNLLNIKSEDMETPLHIATYCNNEEIVKNLILCKANASIGDHDLNTPLHIAIISNVCTEILENLLSVDYKMEFIDAENNEGNTALNLAIENKNMRALKLLCSRGADINKLHKKDGYTPLRSAVEKQNIEMIKYILQHTEVNPLIEDFRDRNPLQAAMTKKNQQLTDLITDYTKRNDYDDVTVKSEIEDYEDEDMEDSLSIKMEAVASEELKEMYSNVKNFTSACLDQLAAILDQSGNWQSLAELLDLGHLIRGGLSDGFKSPTKLLLTVAVETNGDTVLQIRDFLEYLDENEAVQVIDEMVKSIFV